MNRHTVAITGASSGIGSTLALAFARRGYNRGLAARRIHALEQLRDRFPHKHSESAIRINLAAIDVTQESAAPAARRKLFDACGGADIVIANAGIHGITNAGKGDLAEEIRIIRTNLIGGIISVDAAVEHFLGQGCGHLAGISSLASLQPIQRQAAYCASKAGLTMYLDSIRVDLRKTKIRVTGIRPGYVGTNIVDGVDIRSIPFAITPEKAAEDIVALVEKRVKNGIVPFYPWWFIKPLLGHLPARFTAV